MTATENNQTPTSQALAKIDKSPRAMVKRYEDSFAAVLPTHIRPETWLRLAQGALKKGKREADGRTKLEVAAANNPAGFLATLLDCARLGLEPGTDEYYLTPRKVGGRNGRLEILGIVGYQGYIELMYRAGAISSVVCEVVHANDTFIWTPGKLDNQAPPRWQGPMERPYHEVDWDSDDEGALKLAYGYAVMKDGATSKVVVLRKRDIARIKAKSASARSDDSPWNTDEESMWLKSVARQLRKWVPTSAEYRREQMRAADAAGEQRETLDLPLPPGDETPADYSDDDDIADAEIVDEDGGEWAPGEEPM